MRKLFKLTLNSMLTILLLSILVLPVSTMGILGVQNRSPKTEVLPAATVRVEEKIPEYEVPNALPAPSYVPAAELTEPETPEESTESTNVTIYQPGF